MTTIAPDQLPTPTTAIDPSAPQPVAAAWHLPTGPVAAQPAGGVSAARRGRSARMLLAGLAAVAVLGGAAAAVASGGDPGGTTSVAGDRDDDREDDREDEREDERDDERDDDRADDRDDDRADDGDVPSTDLDLAGTYQVLFGVMPDGPTVDCIASLAEPVAADVAAVIEGSATSVDQVASGVSPFAECVAPADFSGALLLSAAQVLQGSTIDEVCAASIVDTFTVTDRIDVLTTAVADPATFAQRVANTFGGCAF